MKNQKIADALILHFIQTVEFSGEPGVGTLRSRPRHEFDEIGNRDLDQVDAGGLEGFEKAARETDRHAVAIPGSFAPPRGKT